MVLADETQANNPDDLAELKTITTARIFNTYSPTKITNSSNAKEITYSDEISIGSPLLNITEFIVDSDAKALPDVSTVINCAVLVKHFSAGNEIEIVNVNGVKNLIAPFKAQNLRLIQFSTVSTVRNDEAA